MELEMQLRQNLVLSPQIIQSMEILQMNVQELSEYIDRILLENPVLERDDGKEPIEHVQRRLEWLEASDNQNRIYHVQDGEGVDPVSTIPYVDEIDLSGHLRSQLEDLDLDQDTYRAAVVITQSLNTSGYLDESLEELAAESRISKKQLAKALDIVQKLEPAGVGARDLSECLCLQLKRIGKTGLPMTLAKEYLEDIAKNKYNYIAGKLNRTQKDVRIAVEIIRSLDPRPGTAFTKCGVPEYVVPDLIVTDCLDRFEIYTQDSVFPTMHVSQYYLELMKSSDDENVKKYLSQKLTQARWIIRSIEQRQSTLMACARELVDIQSEFFRQGPGHMRPMLLSTIADRIDVHETTVSRAIRGKYIQCACGVFPMSYFFSRAVAAHNLPVGAVSLDMAKVMIKRLIDDENRKKPLSDQKICEILAERGVDISRRTIAKYRTDMGIASSSARREQK